MQVPARWRQANSAAALQVSPLLCASLVAQFFPLVVRLAHMHELFETSFLWCARRAAAPCAALRTGPTGLDVLDENGKAFRPTSRGGWQVCRCPLNALQLHEAISLVRHICLHVF